MNSGKALVLAILSTAIVAGIALYYLQVYAFYERLGPQGPQDVQLTVAGADTRAPLAHSGFTAIDSDSSPIRYRACFSTDIGPETLSERFAPYDRPVPRTAPGWFDCFDADAIGAELQAGTAQAFLGQKNIRYGVDRVVAITRDGRGFAWHELNACTDPLASDADKAADCPPSSQDLN